ncbi:hypothetical protein GS646_05565 [Ruegeria sp. HKCCD4315]|uniref:hypothetical protein n=1 Tax=Ruegeria sp. HKCCD4318-2 TaxID=2683020 RepID=UPI00148A03DD|nr:hypothetical protein [Ruegeria sp. HKCCD4318-2]NOD62871.1 hypothetical protein [Ruegeria sp. HKCCD6109]NOD77432.1 hypothetical protein [Ruegeria sp. HKCCD4332]NOD87855.1 hypothetical protein [Ruegeria sp. HKCCD4318]NOD92003.1 hypothetical protein [Ruegeria sp. HKCCD4884]NOG08418.1 hypothetical protein [Ruegeria sp. HKCCD4315]
MMRILKPALLCLVSGMALPVQAQSPIAEILCEPTPRLHQKLKGQFRSERVATGIRGPEQIMEVWSNPRGDWTMVVTYATGTSCIVAMGDNWTAHDKPKPARG